MFSTEQPSIYTEKINRESNDATCMCFMATIESIPGVCHVQWSVKDKNDDTFRPIDLNTEEYKGTSISLPHPVLVVKGKRCLENHCFQIEVTNFVGISTKSIKSKIKKIHSHFLLCCLIVEEQTTV